ncbi:MAG: hypothetical protein ACLFWF_05875 [Alphaproteobacteria bacterium]
MSTLRGWIPGLIAAAALTAALTGPRAAYADDMNACAAVSSSAVRLACFDAAAKDVEDGDVAACARVEADAVRLTCFDAAAGSTKPAGETAAPSAGAASSGNTSSSEDVARLEKEMRAREAAMKARIEALQRKAAEVERRAAEIERRTAAAEAGKKAEKKPEEPEKAFGSKYLDDDDKESAKENFGDREAERPDPLTAKNYRVKKDDDGEIKKIIVKITDIDEGPYGKIKVKLANGQVWKQIGSSPARWDRDGENVAHIRRAFLGSFLMTINDEGAALRVRRVK